MVNPEHDLWQSNQSPRRRRTFLQRLGLSVKPTFEEGPAPRPVDRDLIRGYISKTLAPELHEEVRELIVCYREWHDAELEVLTENGREPAIPGEHF